MRVLVLGVSGMLGSAVFRLLSDGPKCSVVGIARSAEVLKYFPPELSKNIFTGVDVINSNALAEVFARTKPSVVINCVGIVKQAIDPERPLQAIEVNSVLPHRLARLCGVAGSRLIHISTDCVFSGRRGFYSEVDDPDCNDLYGRTKLLGEVEAAHALVLRTSIIGMELAGNRSLVSWFLSQSGRVKSYHRAIFSGLPTVELARIIRDHILPFPDLHGLFHVAAAPIDKAKLLALICEEYERTISLELSDEVVIDRSLDASRFNTLTGYSPPMWPELVRRMRAFG